MIMRFGLTRGSPLLARPKSKSVTPAAAQRRAVRSGFTLIEVIISAALMALILVSAYVCLNACLSSQKMIEPRADVIQNARVAMNLMTADLRNACPLSPQIPFLGMHRMLGMVEADNLDFATHNFTPDQPREGDFCETSYFVDKESGTGQYCLYRRRNPTLALDPLSGGSREEIAEGLLGVRFEYYDGLDWYDSWGNSESNGQQNAESENRFNNEQALPEAVRITLLFNTDPKSKPPTSGEQPPSSPPLAFETVVRLELADRQQTGSTSDNSNRGAPALGETATPGT